MEQETVGVLNERLVDNLLVAGSAEGNGRERLRLAAREDSGAVRSWQGADFAPDGTDVSGLAAVQTLALIEDSAAHSLFLHVVVVSVHQSRHLVDFHAKSLGALLHVVGLLGLEVLANLLEHLLAVVLVGVGRGSLRISTSVRVVVHRLTQFVVVHLVAVLTLHLLAVLAHHLNLRAALRLDSLVSRLNGFEHNALGHLLHLALHHHNVVLRGGNHQFEVGVLALLKRGVDDHLTIHARHAHLANRTLERNVGASQSRRSRQTGYALGHIDAIGTVKGDVDKRISMVISGEERTQSAVDKTRNQYLIVARLALAAGEAAREASGGSEFLLVLNRQRHKVRTRHGILGTAYRRQNHRVAQRRHHGSVRLLRQLARFQRDDTAVRQLNLFSNNVHCLFFVLFLFIL